MKEGDQLYSYSVEKSDQNHEQAEMEDMFTVDMMRDLMMFEIRCKTYQNHLHMSCCTKNSSACMICSSLYPRFFTTSIQPLEAPRI